MRDLRDVIDKVKEVADIVEVASRYVQLKKSGANYKGKSPFHYEKTPSFIVSPSKKIWRDFSYGVGGDVIKLVELMEGIGFMDALRKLALEYGVEIPEEEESVNTSALELYKDWCVERLMESQEAMEYVLSRGVTQGAIEDFEIGYAPSGKESIEFVMRSRIPKDDAVKLGILGERDGRVYARFINRVMFPIRDHTGRLVGFSGRTISGHPAKYVNTPETPIFKKSQVLYGLWNGLEYIKSKNIAVLTEGQLDVVLQHAYGIKGAVASLGTSFTKTHASLLKRYASRAIVAFDPDEAGRKAAVKAAVALLAQKMRVKVAILEDGDPADIIKEHGKKKLLEIYKNATPAEEYIVDYYLGDVNVDDPYVLQDALDKMAELQDIPPAIFAKMKKIAESRCGAAPSEPKRRLPLSKRPKKSEEASLVEKMLLKYALEKDESVLEELKKIKRCLTPALSDEIENGPGRIFAEVQLDDDIPMPARWEIELLRIKIACMKRYIAQVRRSDMDEERKRDRIMQARKKLANLERKLQKEES